MNPKHLSLSQIAEELEVSPSTLSQWQKRYKDDFPQHVEEVGQRRFYRLADIKAFIARHDFSAGKPNTRQQDPIWQTADILRATNASDMDSVLVIAFFACLWSHHRDTLQEIFREGNDALKRVEKPLLVNSREVVERLKLSESQIHQIALIWLEKTPRASAEDCELICNKLRRFINAAWDKAGPTYVSSKSLAKLINKIGRGLEILDIAAGIGVALDEYRREAQNLVGQDINAEVIYLQRLLEFIQFGDPTRELFVSDSLSDYRPEWKNKFDVVICDAPMNVKSKLESFRTDDERWIFLKETSSQSQTDYWIQTALAYLRIGRGIVVVPAGWLSNGPEQAMREALVSGGYIEAVIELGGGLSSGTNIPVSLLILRKTNPPVKQVRVIDATELGELVRGRRTLSTDEIAHIVAVLNGQIEEELAEYQDGLKSIYFKDISLGELLDNDWVLQPRRYRQEKKAGKDSAEILSEIGDLIKAVDNKLAELQEKLKSEEIKKNVGFVLSIKNPERHSFKLGNLYDITSAVEISFKNRSADTKWTTDEINSEDIVVCLTGTQIGNCMYGHEFVESETPWTRILVLRIHDSNFVTPAYVYAWLKFGGFRTQVERFAGGTLLRTINKKDVSRIEIPIPSLETQLLLSSLVGRVEDLNSTGKEADDLNQSLRSKTQELLSSVLAVFELGDEGHRE
jgi:hypothetical protein